MAGLGFRYTPPTGGINPNRRYTPPTGGFNPQAQSGGIQTSTSPAPVGATGTSTAPSWTAYRNMGNLTGQPSQAQLDAQRQRQMEEAQLQASLEALKRQKGAPTPAQLYQQEQADKIAAQQEAQRREQLELVEKQRAEAAALAEAKRAQETDIGWRREEQGGTLGFNREEAAAQRAQEEAMARLKAQLNAEAMEKVQAGLQPYMGGGGAGGSGTEGGGGGTTAAGAAAYGQAKDAIGLQQQGALRSLRNVMAQRGISGSGIEAAGLGSVVTTGQAGLGQASREQAMEQQRRQQEVEDRNLGVLANLYGQYGRVF